VTKRSHLSMLHG